MEKMQFKGTKGNWRLGKYTSTVVSDFSEDISFRSKEEQEYYGGYLIAESIASESDARLIIAAPDLLKACQAVIKIGKGHAPSVGYAEELQDICQKAITKALTGEEDAV